jgi:pimeloyl-ACP methyl ester carboxylesterase
VTAALDFGVIGNEATTCIVPPVNRPHRAHAGNTQSYEQCHLLKGWIAVIELRPKRCRYLHPSALALSLALLGGCAARGDVSRPLPTELVQATQTARRVVVMLPGRGDDLGELQKRGTAQIIQREWPDADVMLVGLTMPFYTSGIAMRRLHDEVMEPLKQRGYRQVWLAGISMGGMGTLMYDHDYPGEVDGMLLLSPYLGESDIPKEIRAAGGLAAWNPGPPQPLGPTTYSREMWRYIRQWSNEPGRTQSVWLAYGADERLRAPIELMSPQLPANHVLMLPGNHNWTLWRPAMGELLRAAGQPEK